MRTPRFAAPKSLNALTLLIAVAALALMTACGGVAASPPGAGAPNSTPTPTPTPAPTPAPAAAPTATLTANPATVPAGQSATLTWSTTNATTVTLQGFGNVNASGSVGVTPAQTTTYTLTATGPGGSANASAMVTVGPAQNISAINHVIFMLQENRSFDDYFGQLGAYKTANNLMLPGDHVDDLPAGESNNSDGGIPVQSFHFNTGCTENVDPDWLGSHGDFNVNDPGTTTAFLNNGWVHNAQGTARTAGIVTEVGGGAGTLTVNPQKTSNYYLFQSAAGAENFSSLPIAVVSVTVTGDISPSPAGVSGAPAGTTFTATPTTVAPGQPVVLTWNVPGAGQTMVNTYFDQLGRRAMGFYDSNDLNYYYFMAANFATSDRWFSPIPSNSPPNRFSLYAATTHGHAHDPGTVDSSVVKNIFQLLDAAGITWKVYFTIDPNLPNVPHTMLTRFQPFASQHPNNLVPTSQYFTDLKNGTLAQVSFIEELPGFDEHPGATLAGSIHAGNHIQDGAQYVSTFINTFMQSPYWADGVFFLTYDEAGGFFDHVQPEPAVSPDGLLPTDLRPEDIQFISPPADFTRTGFRVPLLVVSPFTKKSFVSHTPADFTAILKFIETRFKLPNLTARDAAQMDMQEFFDFVNVPWKTAPVPPLQNKTLPCDYSNLH